MRDVLTVSVPLTWWKKRQKWKAKRAGNGVGEEQAETGQKRLRRDNVFKVCYFGGMLLFASLSVSAVCVLMKAR